MYTKAILLLLAFHIFFEASSQRPCTATFSGVVVNSEGERLPGANVFLTPGNIGMSTDAGGRFAFKDLCSGTYNVNVQYVGYKNVTSSIKISGTHTRTFLLEEEATQLNEVVVSHHDAENTEHATNFSLVNEKKLAESAGKTIGATLMKVPGVTVLQTGPGIFKPVVHGLHSQRLLILNHGIRQEGQQWGAEHAPEIDPFIASNLVVIKDASAIKFGPDALGGVIVVNPPALPEKNELAGTVATVVQSNGRSGTISGMLEGGIGKLDGWGWRVQGTAKRGGDFHTPDYSLTNSGVREFNFSVAAGYHVKKIGVDVFFSRFQSELGIIKATAVGNLEDLVAAMERDVPLYTEDFSYSISQPRQEVRHNLLKANVHFHGDEGEWRFQYGFQDNDRSEYAMRIGGLFQIPTLDLNLTTHTLDAEWETHHSERRTFVIGTNAMFQQNRNVPGTQRIPFIPNFDNVSAGVFATSKFFFTNWTLDAGVRYDFRAYSVKGFDFKNTRYDASLDFNNVSASLGMTHDLSSAQTIKLNVSTSWRPPHVSELYSLGTHQSAAAIEYGLMLDKQTNEVRDVSSVDFSAEQAFKAVATYGFRSDRLSVEASAYTNYIANYIYLRPQGITRNLSGTFPYFRYDQTNALMLGFDIDASIKLHHYVNLAPKVSFLRARDVKEGSYFLFVPSSRYAVDVRYEKPTIAFMKNAYVEAGGVFVSKQNFSPRVISPQAFKEASENNTDPFNGDQSAFDFMEAPDGYVLANVAAGFSLKASNMKYDFRIAAENLLNESYRDYANRLRYYADEMGRNLIFSMKIIF